MKHIRYVHQTLYHYNCRFHMRIHVLCPRRRNQHVLRAEQSQLVIKLKALRCTVLSGQPSGKRYL